MTVRTLAERRHRPQEGPARAIVLTYDRYRSLTEHMMFKYETVWPEHPFRFRVPYQDLPTVSSARVEPWRTPDAAIKPTVIGLLEDLDDEEWVYWCIDDKYLIALDLPKVVALSQWIRGLEASEISGVLFCRCREMLRDDYLTGEKILDEEGNAYLERRAYDQIWIHQFLRVKVIRHLFRALPDDIPSAWVMDVFKRYVKKPESHRLFVREDNLAVFGESTLRGVVTQNCHDSILANHLALPEWFSETNGKTITTGKLGVAPQ